jgi:hypothetical protein
LAKIQLSQAVAKNSLRLEPYMSHKLMPFDPDADPLKGDFDSASKALQAWLGEALPRYRRAPEYKALAPQHRQSKGSWFTLFMELNLMYFSGALQPINAETADEILCELLPRKLLVNETQIESLIPELIACWQWLRRIFASRHPLQHADAIIELLQELEPDYAAIYHSKDATLSTLEPALNPSAAQNQGDIDWVEALIEDAALTPSPTQPDMPPPEAWLILHSEPLFSQFIAHLLLDGFDTDCEATVDAVDNLLRFGLQNVQMRLRQSDQAAVDFWARTEKFIITTTCDHSAIQESLELLINALAPLRHYLSEEFITVVQDWQSEHSARIAEAQSSPGESLSEGLLALLAEVDDEFLFLSMIKDQLAFLPTEAMMALFDSILDIGEPQINNALTLLVLDNDSGAGLAVATLLASRPHDISATSLGRLIRIRNWLEREVQKPIDQAVRAARKLGVVPAQTAAPEDCDLVEVYASGIDGVGAQGIMLIVRTGRRFRLISFVLKENIGIVDAMVSPAETRGFLQQTIKQARAATGTMHPVEPAMIRQQVPIFLALNLHSAVSVEHELIQAMELIGLDNWNPTAIGLEQLLPDTLLSPPSAAELRATQTRSAKWIQGKLGSCWFDDIAFINALLELPQEQQINTICTEILQPARPIWHQRMLRMALWAQHARSQTKRKQARDFSTIAWLLHQDGPIEDIQLMRAIAENSLYHETLQHHETLQPHHEPPQPQSNPGDR